MHQKILILDFGSQYTQLIARRVRELNVYCEIHPYNSYPEPDEQTLGIILSGSPASVHDEEAPMPNIAPYEGKFPMLGICYGAQLLNFQAGGVVSKSAHREYGRAFLKSENNCALFNGFDRDTQVWMSHGDTITTLPNTFEVIAQTESIPVAGFKKKGVDLYGIQFHPEVTHTIEGSRLLGNFLFDICGCKGDWTPAHFVDETVAEIQSKVKEEKVILGLSGGVDSSVAAILISKAIHKNLYCIFINNGLLRKNEYEEVLEAYKQLDLNVKGVDASDAFYDALEGISDPEQKRKIIGRVFVEIFDQEASKIDGAKWLAQGTIYPDVI
jgi:GMP synthase (glutamine-hydrolysing)